MLHRIGVSLIVLCLALAPHASASVFLLDFLGYSYLAPNGDDIMDPDNYYQGLGEIQEVNPTYLTIDEATYQYTVVIETGLPTSIDVIADYVSIAYGDARIDFYEDAIAGGTPFDYGINPPNATAPSTFEDGLLILGGAFDHFTIVTNMTTGVSTLDGVLDLDAGSQLGNIPDDQLAGWAFAGQGWDLPDIPEGYIWQIDGEVYIASVATEEVSWGSVKTLYE